MAIDLAMCFGGLFRVPRAEAVKTVTQLIPSFAPATLEGCTVGVRTCARSLLLHVRLTEGAAGCVAAGRLAFWTACAGGVARRLGEASAAEIESIELALAASDRVEHAAAPEDLWDVLERAFALLWGPDARARTVPLPVLLIRADEVGHGGAGYEPFARRLFVPSALAPPVGDELGLALDGAPSSAARVCGTVRVAEVGLAANVRPGVPGFFLVAEDEPLHRALAHAHSHAGAPSRSFAARARNRGPERWAHVG